MDSDRVAQVARFLEGLNDLTAKTGVFIEFYAEQPVSIDNGPEEKPLNTGLGIVEMRDGGGLIRYRVAVRDT